MCSRQFYSLLAREMKEKAGQKLSSTTAVGRGTGKKTKKVCVLDIIFLMFYLLNVDSRMIHDSVLEV